MGIYHGFQSTAPDPPDTPITQEQVWGSDWDAAHNAPDFLLLQICGRGTASAAYAVPAGIVEFLNATIHRTRFDLTYVDEIRLTVDVAKGGYPSAQLRAQWSSDGGSTWNYFADGNHPQAPLNVLGPATSGWQPLTAAAKAAGDVLVRLVTSGGDGIATTQFGLISLHVF